MLSCRVNMDKVGGLQLKKLFRRDEVHHDNWLFKLHHQVNFFVILVGFLFIFGENYLNGKAIVCVTEQAYANQYCWLHGTGHLNENFRKDYAKCSMNNEDDRETHYYLWLPSILLVCMGLVKIPRVVWKTLCERGIMASLVGDGAQTGEKIATRFKKLKKRSVGYHIYFAVCELLNIAMLLICFQILDSLLNGQFWSYGADVSTYYRTKLPQKELEENSDLGEANPMCSLFPTDVACNYCTGSIGGGCNDKQSVLCILSNNLFNQYFFLILWFWWVFLLFISIIGVLYRAAQMSIPSFSKSVFQTYLTPYGLDDSDLSLRSADYFLLGRLAINLKGSIMQEVIKELIHPNASQGEETPLEIM
eukprot:GFUD01037441.1.p1 GENE.GFUD01037441.1~~GFUD01037441.1.p1  ORF type:complete len:362 (+),score=67.14 GFUD01037441.1:187-1272(+)